MHVMREAWLMDLTPSTINLGMSSVLRFRSALLTIGWRSWAGIGAEHKCRLVLSRKYDNLSSVTVVSINKWVSEKVLTNLDKT